MAGQEKEVNHAVNGTFNTENITIDHWQWILKFRLNRYWEFAKYSTVCTIISRAP